MRRRLGERTGVLGSALCQQPLPDTTVPVISMFCSRKEVIFAGVTGEVRGEKTLSWALPRWGQCMFVSWICTLPSLSPTSTQLCHWPRLSLSLLHLPGLGEAVHA